MRKSLLVGLVLTVVAVLVTVVSDLLDLELDSVTLLGVALGGVVATVPDRSQILRLCGFAAGAVAAWLGYVARAALLPDSTSGRTVALALVLLLCTALAAVSLGRLPLWSTLLGAAGLVGAYEYAYAAAPAEVTSTSATALTSLAVAVIAGFIAGGVLSGDERSGGPHDDSATDAREHGPHDQMETIS